MTPAAAAALAAAAVAVTLFPAAAHAERETVATFSGGISAVGPLDPPDAIGGPEVTAFQFRAIVSFEHPTLPYRVPHGVAARGTIVPELFVGLLSGTNDTRTEMVGGGARFEIMFSQASAGPLRLSMRGGVYFAARGGLFTDPSRTRFYEGAMGEYLAIGDGSTRIGIEGAIMSIRTSDPDLSRPVVDGSISRAPFVQGRGSYLSVNALLYLGVTL